MEGKKEGKEKKTKKNNIDSDHEITTKIMTICPTINFILPFFRTPSR